MSTSNGNESTWKSPFCYENMFLYPNPVLQPRFIFLPLSLSPIKKKTNRIFLSEKKAVQVQSQVVDFDNVC
jgi:hypothetical protein